jgi:hypothetical protein
VKSSISLSKSGVRRALCHIDCWGCSSSSGWRECEDNWSTISVIGPLDSTLQHEVGGGESSVNEQSVGDGKVSSTGVKEDCAWAPKVKCSNMMLKNAD